MTPDFGIAGRKAAAPALNNLTPEQDRRQIQALVVWAIACAHIQSVSELPGKLQKRALTPLGTVMDCRKIARNAGSEAVELAALRDARAAYRPKPNFFARLQKSVGL